MANFSNNFFRLIICFGAVFLPGFLSHPDTGFPGPYLTGEPVKFYETDPNTKQVISYEIVPYESSSTSSRQKRQVTIPSDDKSQFSKSSPTKKPIDTKGIWLTPSTNGTTGRPIIIGQSQSSSVSVETSHVEIPSTTEIVTNIDTKSSNVNVVGGIPSKNGDSDILNKNVASKKVPLEDHEVYPDSPWETDELDKLYQNGTWKKEHNYTNVTFVKETHKYYNSSYHKNGNHFWIDLDKEVTAVDHPMLKDAHRRAATLKLKFIFPFYGHSIDNVTVATGGFVYLGEQVHAWLAATQYVAPLMANFDSSVSENATVRYLSNDTFFTVEWRKVHLQDSQTKGPFTFQTTLWENGTIVFAYKEIPIPIQEINDTMHPVKVGLSDAYIRDRTMLFVKQKTIYEYHRVDLKEHPEYVIENGSAIVFSANPTCPSFKTCEVCTNEGAKSAFTCGWCPTLNRCSDGTDRGRQEWISHGCEKEGGLTAPHINECKAMYTSTAATYITRSDHRSTTHADTNADQNHIIQQLRDKQEYPPGMSASGVIGVLFLVMLVFGGVGWVFYAYLYPHTPSGQFLIRYRPTQWAFRRGEARYTAASIHM